MPASALYPPRERRCPRALGRIRRTLPSRRGVLFTALLALYVALTIAVLVGSPLDGLDRWVRTLTVQRRSPGWRRFVLDYVMLGQRGPSTAVAMLWIAWLCHARRTLDPLIRIAVALLILNLSVGVVKIGTGRWGPRVTAHARDVFAGGDIFPSGHVSNAVVLFGVLAVLASQHRQAMTAVAVWISLTVGLGTLYLDTHWVTDVLGGWMAGALVLMVLPRTVRFVETRLEGADIASGRRLAKLRYLPGHATTVPIMPADDIPRWASPARPATASQDPCQSKTA